MNKSIYYPGTNNIVRENDIVRINIGICKNDLAIITIVDRPNKRVTIKNIKNSMQFTFNIRNVTFCYHNTKAAAKIWYEQMEKYTVIYYNRYKSAEYIINNWFIDIIIKNSITSITLQKLLNFDISSNNDKDNIDWLIYWEKAIDICISYKDYKFCVECLDKLYPGKYKENVINNLCQLINKYSNNGI